MQKQRWLNFFNGQICLSEHLLWSFMNTKLEVFNLWCVYPQKGNQICMSLTHKQSDLISLNIKISTLLSDSFSTNSIISNQFVIFCGMIISSMSMFAMYLYLCMFLRKQSFTLRRSIPWILLKRPFLIWGFSWNINILVKIRSLGWLPARVIFLVSSTPSDS